ncbi:hypothetical protein F4782DRAFT_331 [Xylaria castorea]|nr:hypothetical protein F4782DRAFT_331 [Xylaria castorea]
MPLHPNLVRSLRGRRNIILSDNRTQEALANPFPFRRVQHPAHRPDGNRSLSTNVAGNSLPQTPNQGRGIPRHQTRDSITPSSLSLGNQPVYQPSPAQTGHVGSVNPGLPQLELPQSAGNYTPISGQGPMTVGNGSSSHLQMTPYSSVPPSIVVESHDQQQVHLPGPSLSQSGRRQLSSSALEPFNQYPFSIGQQRNNTQDQLLPELQPLLLVGWDALVIARVDKSVYNSCIYKDALPRLLKRADWEKFVCPWPPNHITVTMAGYNSSGGECIQLALLNRDGQVVEIALAVIDSEELHRTEIRGVDVMLCQNYFSALVTRQNMPIGIERQTGGIGYSNAGYQWPIPVQSQNAINHTENPGYGYASPMWPPSGNQMEGIQIHPQQLAPSFPFTVSSASQSGSAAIVSSTTSPDVPFPMGGAMPFSQVLHPTTPPPFNKCIANILKNPYPSMSWPQPDKSGS